jgi:uncharacterized protein (DUF2141 family)
MRAVAVMLRPAVAALAAWSLGVTIVPQTRDITPAAAPAGSAVVAGRVVSAEAQPAAVRHATVTLGGGNLRGTRDVITDDQGRFTFTGLPAGAYSLSAAKTAWVTSYYGGRRPGVPPFTATPLVIADGEQKIGIELRLLHGSAITGVVRDAAGAPASVQVQLMQFRVTGGVRSVVWVAGTSTSDITDDRGVYRLFGIAPGEYLVSARKTSMGDDLHLMTPATLQSAMQTASSGAPPVAVTTPDQGRAVRFTDVYYPGTVDAGAATILKVGANEERTNVDFALQLVPTARISGVVVGIDGRPPVNAMIHLEVPTVRPEGDGPGDVGYATSFTVPTERDGTFVKTSVPPGQYRIVVRADDPAAAPTGRASGPGGAPSLWAAQGIAVDGHDMSGLTLTLQPGMVVGGRVSAAASVDLSKCLVVLRPVLTGVNASRSAVGADGSFTFSGIAPGWYRLDVAATAAGGGAKIASARIGQSDVADLPFEVHPSTDITNMAVTLTDALGEITGTLRDAADRPAPHYVIVVFSTDRAYWTSKNRRMPAPSETLADGRFRIGDLPAGEYFIFTATDIDPDSLQDPTMLGQLASQALHVTLGESEKKVQDFRLSGGSETSVRVAMHPSETPWPTTRRSTLTRGAPKAIRMAVSRVRLVTSCESNP